MMKRPFNVGELSSNNGVGRKGEYGIVNRRRHDLKFFYSRAGAQYPLKLACALIRR